MQFGISLVSDDLAAFERRIRAIDELGFDLAGIGDSPKFDDVYVSLTLAARATSRTRIGPFVTNPITRQPAVTTTAMRGINRLSGGRAFLGLGAGDSAVRGLGLAPAGPDGLASAVSQLREAGVPIFLAANGPRTLALGGRLADAVVIGSGHAAGALAWARDAATAQPRADGLSSLEVWVVVRCWITDDPGSDRHVLDALLASAGNHVFQARLDGVPLSSQGPIRELRRRYSYSHHGATEDNPNLQLIDELGLREFLLQRFGILSSAADAVATLRRLEANGVDGVIVPAIVADPDELIRRLGTEVMPVLRESPPHPPI